MSLLTDLPDLKEMEQAFGHKDGIAEADLGYLAELYDAAPAMLAVLECFQEGDAIGLNQVASYIELYVIERQDQESKRAHWVELAVMLRRLQEAARRMVE